jgi:hypothetical protein
MIIWMNEIEKLISRSEKHSEEILGIFYLLFELRAHVQALTELLPPHQQAALHRSRRKCFDEILCKLENSSPALAAHLKERLDSLD